MPCYRPVTAFKPAAGGPVSFSEVKDSREIKVKCGQCIGCRLERQQMWAIRCMVEAKCHERNSFVTLTYNEENYPQHGSLNYRHVQLFLKRLRKRCGPFRYFVAGEYGEELNRPHYHALLFGLDFSDKSRCNSICSLHPIYRSSTLEELWKHGFSSIGDVTFSSARYVATYCVKKINGPLAEDHYKRVIPETGEIVDLEPEFAHMSLKPGIGAKWLEAYWRDLYVTGHNAVIVDGKKKAIPRYFDKLMEKLDPALMEEVDFDRFKRAEIHASDNTRDRLAVREQVEHARMAFEKQKRGQL